MKILKVNELFDSNKTYSYIPVSKKKDPVKSKENFIYTFTSDDDTKYFVELENVEDEYLSCEFADEENYKKGGKNKYKLTNKHDAIKIINTVIKIGVDFMKWHDIDMFAINTDEDRLETYKYIMAKYFKGWDMHIKPYTAPLSVSKTYNVWCTKPSEQDNPQQFIED